MAEEAEKAAEEAEETEKAAADKRLHHGRSSGRRAAESTCNGTRQSIRRKRLAV